MIFLVDCLSSWFSLSTACLHDFPYNKELMFSGWLFVLIWFVSTLCLWGRVPFKAGLLACSCEPIVLTVRSGIWVTGFMCWFILLDLFEPFCLWQGMRFDKWVWFVEIRREHFVTGMFDLVMFCLVLLYYSEEFGFYFESTVRSVIWVVDFIHICIDLSEQSLWWGMRFE